MGINSKIEWCENTFNPWIGCAKISPACDHCYAADLSARTFKVKWGVGEARKRTSEAYWKQPLKWNAEAAKAGVRPRVFCASLADVFDNEVDPQWRADLFSLIRKTPSLDWMILTKRIGNAEKMMQEACDLMGSGMGVFAPSIYPNLHLGATICNQAEADRDIPKLLATPAAKRFLSIEPMLGPIDLVKSEAFWTDGLSIINQVEAADSLGYPPTVDLVIAGGESGPHARPSHPDWFRSLRDQCASAGVPFMFKQWGEFGPFVNEAHYTRGGAEKHAHAHAWVDGDTAESGKVWLYDDDGLWVNWTGTPPNDADGDISNSIAIMGRHGKKAAGRLLDGVEHNGRIAL